MSIPLRHSVASLKWEDTFGPAKPGLRCPLVRGIAGRPMCFLSRNTCH